MRAVDIASESIAHMLNLFSILPSAARRRSLHHRRNLAAVRTQALSRRLWARAARKYRDAPLGAQHEAYVLGLWGHFFFSIWHVDGFQN